MAVQTEEPISEARAKELLSDTKGLRRDWALFAVRSKDHFDAFREKGASFPDVFMKSYRELETRKSRLADSIRVAAAGVDAAAWIAPEATESLHEFEAKLTALVEICRQLAKIAAEKRNRCVRTLTAVTLLKSADAEVDELLAKIRQEAEAELGLLSSKPFRIVDSDLEQKVVSLESLLALADDARTRQTVSENAETRLTSADCTRNFEVVSERFGLSVAIDALRFGLWSGALLSSDSPRSVAAEQPVLKSHEDARAPIVPTTAADPASLESTATSDQIQSLIKNFSNRPASPVAGKKIHATAAVPVKTPNPVSLSELAAASKRLKEKANELWPEANSSNHPAEHLCTEKIRAMGFNNLSLMIEMAGFIFSERENNPRFYRQQLHEFLALFAEAQNAVRVESEEASLGTVSQQLLAFNWLKHICSTDGESILLERYMRREDRAEPANNPDVSRRIASMYRQLAAVRRRNQNFTDLKRCCARLEQDQESHDVAFAVSIWTQIDQLVSQLIQSGAKPNDAKLREVLLPVVDFLPEPGPTGESGVEAEGVDISSEFRQVIDTIHEYLESLPEEDESIEETSPPPEIEKVRDLLSGRTLVVVGGVCKPHAASRIRRQLKLDRVRWLSATKQDRVSEFRADLKDAAVVVLITKLIGHKHNDIREMCRELGIPYAQTRYAAGYSVSQIATAILEQASDQLTGRNSSRDRQV